MTMLDRVVDRSQLLFCEDDRGQQVDFTLQEALDTLAWNMGREPDANMNAPGTLPQMAEQQISEALVTALWLRMCETNRKDMWRRIEVFRQFG